MTEEERQERNRQIQGIVAQRQAQGLEASFNAREPKEHVLATGPVPGTDLHAE